MNVKIIGISILAALVVVGAGGTFFLKEKYPEKFNDIIRLAAYTPEQAFEENIPLKEEVSIYKTSGSTIIPVLFDNKEDLTKLDELYDDIFESGSKPIVKEDFRKMALDFFEGESKYKYPYSVKGTTSGKDVCFIVGADHRFEKQSLNAQCIFGGSKGKETLGLVTSSDEDVAYYLDYYNDSYDPAVIASEVYDKYFLSAAGDVKASMELKRGIVNDWIKITSKGVKEPNVAYMNYRVPYISLAISEFDAGNIKVTSDIGIVFNFIDEQITGSGLTKYNILDLLMHEREAIIRVNSARKYVLENNDIRSYLGLKEIQ